MKDQSFASSSFFFHKLQIAPAAPESEAIDFRIISRCRIFTYTPGQFAEKVHPFGFKAFSGRLIRSRGTCQKGRRIRILPVFAGSRSVRTPTDLSARQASLYIKIYPLPAAGAVIPAQYASFIFCKDPMSGIGLRQQSGQSQYSWLTGSAPGKILRPQCPYIRIAACMKMSVFAFHKNTAGLLRHAVIIADMADPAYLF